MTRPMKHGLALLIGVSLTAGAALAQSTDGEAADTSPSGLSTGIVEGEIQVGQTYVREEFNTWQLRCVKTENDKDPCQLYQLLNDAEGNSVAEFNMFPLPEGQQAVAGANIVTPLETLLTANLRMAIDGGQTKVYPYSFLQPGRVFLADRHDGG